MLPSRLFYDSMLDEITNRDILCDIYEQNGSYKVEMDIPGFKKNEIKVECHKGTVIISAYHEFKKDEHGGKKYLKRERHYGKIERSIYLGDIDEDGIKAEYKDGTLFMNIPIKRQDNRKLINID